MLVYTVTDGMAIEVEHSMNNSFFVLLQMAVYRSSVLQENSCVIEFIHTGKKLNPQAFSDAYGTFMWTKQLLSDE